MQDSKTTILRDIFSTPSRSSEYVFLICKLAHVICHVVARLGRVQDGGWKNIL